MKQITQKEFMELIREKQKEASNNLYGGLKEERIIEKLAYIEAYQNIIRELNSVEIVTEHKVSPITIDTQEEVCNISQEDLNKILYEAAISQRYDRIREFEKTNFHIALDAKDVKNITMFRDEKYNNIEVYVDEVCVKRVCHAKENDEAESLAFYKEIVEWWKYWKQN